MEQKKTCPICHNHCTEDATECEKGQEFFREGNKADQPHHHSREFEGHGEHGRGHHHGGHGEHGHGHHHEGRGEHGHGHHHGGSEKIPRDSLTGLFMRCSYHLRNCLHGGNDSEAEIFGCLSDAEKAELKGILTKMVRAGKKPDQFDM